LQSAKTEELLKLRREFWLRTGGRKRKLLVRGVATRLLGCWCGSRLPLSRVFKRSNWETAHGGREPFHLDPLHYDFAAYAGRRWRLLLWRTCDRVHGALSTASRLLLRERLSALSIRNRASRQ